MGHGRHDVGHPHAVECAPELGDPLLGVGRRRQEPPDRRQPDAVEPRAAAELDQAQQRSAVRPGPGRPGWRPCVARSRSPERRHSHECRTRPPSSGAPGRMLNTARATLITASHQTVAPHSRPNPSQSLATATTPNATPMSRLTSGPTPEIRSSAPGVGDVAVDAGEPAHQPQHDAVDFQALVPGDDGVAELVGQDAGEEHQCGEPAGDGVEDLRVARRLGGKTAAGQAEGEEGGDDQQASS